MSKKVKPTRPPKVTIGKGPPTTNIVGDVVWDAREDFGRFLQELQKESDRAAAVLGAAHLESMLEALLRRSFTFTSDYLDNLLRPDGPLGTFSSKINLAHSMGLLTLSESKDLHWVRQIRNKFAHHLVGLSFKDDQVADWSKNFILIKHLVKALEVDPYSNPRIRFNFAIAYLGVRLDDRIRAIAPIPQPLDPFRESW